jgi:hypothetical protein
MNSMKKTFFIILGAAILFQLASTIAFAQGSLTISPDDAYDIQLASCREKNDIPEFTCEQQAAATRSAQQTENDCLAAGGSRDFCAAQANQTYTNELGASSGSGTQTQQCSGGQLYDSSTNRCVGSGTAYRCSQGTWGDYITGTCSTTCSNGQQHDWTTGDCTSTCQSGHSCTPSPTSGGGSGSTNSQPTNIGNVETALDCKNGKCTYVLLEPLPGNFPAKIGSDSDFYAYLNGIIMFFIIIGAMLAVVRFSIGGILYMTSDVVSTRTKAKSQMWACIWGLLLLVSSVLILRTVNPELVKLTFLTDLTTLQSTGNK